MENKITLEQIGDVSMEKIIAAVQAARDTQIEELMNEPILLTFLEHYYDTIAISDVKKAFLVKALGELKRSPLNLSHYSSLITQMKELKTLEVSANHKLFLIELKEVFQKYVTSN
jgi:hypothetical protein